MYSGGLDSFPAFLILAALGVSIVLLLTRDQLEKRRRWLVIALYLAFLASVFFFPLPITREAIDYSRWRAEQGLGQKNNFQLFAIFRTTWGRSSFIRQVGGNFSLLIPFGAILGVSKTKIKTMKSIAIIILTVLAIETLQAIATAAYGFPFRSFDVDDLWLNTAGGFTGLLIIGLMRRGGLQVDEWSTKLRLNIGR